MPAFVKLAPFCLAGLFLLTGLAQAVSPGPHYTGRVLYRANKAPVAGVLGELVEAEDSGEPTAEILGSTRADADGHFVVTLSQPTGKPVTLVVSAVRTFADSSGDRRSEGYDIKTHQTRLGYLPHPSPTKPNTIFIERRRPGRGDE